MRRGNTIRNKNIGLLLLAIFCVLAILFIIFVFKSFYYFESVSVAGNIEIKIFLIMNIFAFLAVWIDKQLSVINTIRFSNISMYIICALGGGIGSAIARRKFRHKVINHKDVTKKYNSIFKTIELSSFLIYFILFIVIC